MKRLATSLVLALFGGLAVLSDNILAKEVLVDLTQGVPNGPTITQVGDTLKIKANENPTTGYTWMVVNRPHQEDPSKQVLADLQERYVPNHSQEGMQGVGGVKYLTFNALCEGDDNLELVNAQHWLLNKLIDQDTGKVHWENASENEIDVQVIQVPVTVQKVGTQQ